MNTNEYGYNDYRLYLEHSWGKKPEQKAAEKAYNAKYYLENKARILAKRAGEATGISQKRELTKAQKELDPVKARHDMLDKDIDNAGELVREAQERSWDNRSKRQENQIKELEESRRNLREQQAAWDVSGKLFEKQSAVTDAKKRYSKTPLGKAEGAVSSGKEALSNLLKKRKK